jgi:hypothetical protein
MAALLFNSIEQSSQEADTVHRSRVDPERNGVLRQCKVPRAEVMFVTIQRENIRPSKKEMNKTVNNAYNARCLQLGYESLSLLIADQ